MEILLKSLTCKAIFYVQKEESENLSSQYNVAKIIE